jgi:hypothetical protein
MAFTAFIFWIVGLAVWVLLPLLSAEPIAGRIAEAGKYTFIVALAAWFYLSR